MISDDEGDKLENNDHWLIGRVRIIHFAIFYIKKLASSAFPFRKYHTEGFRGHQMGITYKGNVDGFT